MRDQASLPFSSSPIHPSPLPGGRLGGGWNAASQHRSRAAPRIARAASAPPFPPSLAIPPPPLFLSLAIPLSPSFLRPLPSFLRRQERALTAGIPPSPRPTLFPNSSLPPSRGEVRWGVERRKPAPQSRHAPIARVAFRSTIPALPRRSSPSVVPLSRHSSFSVIPARPFRHSCVGRNARSPRASRRAHAQPSSPIHPSPLPGGRLGGGWNAASQHRSRDTPRIAHIAFRSTIPALSPSFLRRQEHGLQRRYAPQHPDGLAKWLSSAAGDAGRGEAWSRARSCLRRNDERGAGMMDRGVARLVAAARCLPPPT